jgi:hypothetical protein
LGRANTQRARPKHPATAKVNNPFALDRSDAIAALPAPEDDERASPSDSRFRIALYALLTLGPAS